jgi:hypothetical protein
VLFRNVICVFSRSEFSKCRLPTPELIVHAGVLNNSWQAPEDNREVRQVVQVFLHEEFHIDTYSNDIAILKVQNISKWLMQILCTFVHKQHYC